MTESLGFFERLSLHAKTAPPSWSDEHSHQWLLGPHPMPNRPRGADGAEGPVDKQLLQLASKVHSPPADG